MNYSAISVRYTKALYQLAKEKNELKEVFEHIVFIHQIISQTKDLEQVITNPVIPSRTKINLIEKAFKDRINPDAYSFILLMLQNKREEYLLSSLRYFEYYYKKENGITTVQLTTAIPLESTVKNEIKGIIRSNFNITPEFHDKVDKNIIGGFIIRMDDQQIDSSVATQLDKFKEQLIK